MLTSPTELSATWITKLAGFSFVVSRCSADRRFHGRVATFSDIRDEYSKNRGQVVFRQVRCPKPMLLRVQLVCRSQAVLRPSFLWLDIHHTEDRQEEQEAEG